MTRFVMEINLDNDYYRAEYGSKISFDSIAETLKTVCDAVEEGHIHHYIYDGNGNCVGEWEIEG